MNNKKILITGATGFIGKFLVEELLCNGYVNLTALVRHTSDASFLQSKGVKLMYGDISDEKSLAAIDGDWEVVFHCAGFVGNNAKMLKRINVLGTKNICRFALTRGVKKFIYVSSIAVNSGNIETPLTEDLPYKPTNRYGVSKMEAEKNAIQFRGQGLPMVILRPCMVYGEREPHLIPLLINLMRSRLIFIPYFADAYLHLVSVRNVAACFVRCMEDDRALGHVFNVADKEIFTLHELFEIISESLGIKEPPTLPKFLTNVLMLMPIIGKRIKFLSKDRLYDIIRLKDCIDFAPPYSAKSELFNTFKLPRQLSLT